MRKRRLLKGSRRLQFLSLLIQTTFCTQFFPTLRCMPTTCNFTIRMSSVHESYFTNNFMGTISGEKRVLNCEVYDYEEFSDEILETLLSELFFTRRMKVLSRPEGFMLYGNLGVYFFATSAMKFPNMKIRLRLIRAKLNFYMISNNSNFSLGNVDCSACTHPTSLKDDHQRKGIDILA